MFLSNFREEGWVSSWLIIPTAGWKLSEKETKWGCPAWGLSGGETAAGSGAESSSSAMFPVSAPPARPTDPPREGGKQWRSNIECPKASWAMKCRWCRAFLPVFFFFSFFNLPIFFRFIFYYCFINVTRWCYKVLNSSSNTHHIYLKYINKNNYITLLNKVSLRQLESWWSGFLKFRDPFLNICFLNGTVSWLQVDTTLAYTSTGFESHGCVGSFCSKAAYSPCALQLLPMAGMHVRLTGKKNKTKQPRINIQWFLYEYHCICTFIYFFMRISTTPLFFPLPISCAWKAGGV